MTNSIVDVSRTFFLEVVKPILEKTYPAETAQSAFGLFGYGSEALGLDDEYSRDHHWGLRVNALMPEGLLQERAVEIIAGVDAALPATYGGYSLQEGFSGGKGLSLLSLEGFLRQTIGIDHAPVTWEEWLGIPEEDITHVTNGEIWHDPSGQFSAIRKVLTGHYPEPVRLRRIAHWCRYCSGMGSYALHRALLRHNEYYATVTFSRSLRWGLQIAFLLDRVYFPYDKWIMAYLPRLPRLAAPMATIIEEATALTTSWSRKLGLLNQMADVLDRTMVEDGIIRPHPPFQESPTSGYRILEHAYAEIIQGLPPEIQTLVPVWDQVYLEAMHSSYVASIDLDQWDTILNLRPLAGEDEP